MVRLASSVVAAPVLGVASRSTGKGGCSQVMDHVERWAGCFTMQSLFAVGMTTSPTGWRAEDWVLHVGDGAFQRGIFAEKNGAPGTQLMGGVCPRDGG
jgi:hypothetical protein